MAQCAAAASIGRRVQAGRAAAVLAVCPSKTPAALAPLPRPEMRLTSPRHSSSAGSLLRVARQRSGDAKRRCCWCAAAADVNAPQRRARSSSVVASVRASAPATAAAATVLLPLGGSRPREGWGRRSACMLVDHVRGTGHTRSFPGKKRRGAVVAIYRMLAALVKRAWPGPATAPWHSAPLSLMECRPPCEYFGGRLPSVWETGREES